MADSDYSSYILRYNLVSKQPEYFAGSDWYQDMVLGASFPIGSIAQVSSAPTGTGTWLAADGSSVSQSTYASLFASIGHGYMEFTATPNATPALTTPGNVLWTGSVWGVTSAAPNLYYTSSNGTSWSSVSMPNSTKNLVYNPSANTILSFSAGSATANISTDGGATFGTHTLPVSPTANNNVVAPGNSTTTFLLINGSARTVYTMASGGTTWTTTTNALPFIPNFIQAGFWDGSVWTVIGPGAVFQTSDPAGISSWATVSQTATFGGLAGSLISVIRGSSIVTAQPAVNSISTNDGISFTSYAQNPVRVTSVAGLNWNGYCYVLRGGGNVLNYYLTSADGKQYNSTNPGSSVVGQVAQSGGSFISTSSSLTNNPLMDTATGRFVDYFTPGGTTVTTPVGLVLMTPTPNVNTQFSLPYIPGSFIRAL